jgi:dihydrodipicolinate synthase/N-acetylneuraminate lyase
MEEQLRPLAMAIESEPFFYMHDRYKEAACMLGVIPNTLVRPPSLQISDTERAKLREAMIASELLVPKSKTLFQV